MSTSVSDIQLVQMMSSKLCHDLVTPVGAINNGIELLVESHAGAMDEVIDLVGQSAQTTTQRLSLFRFAFGVGSAVHIHALSDIEPFLMQSIDRKRYSLHWKVEPMVLAGNTHVKTWAKIFCNVLMLAMESAPYGGQILIEATELQDSFALNLTLKAQRVCWPEIYSRVLAKGLDAINEELTVRNVQPYFAWRLGQLIGAIMNVEHTSRDSLQLSLGNHGVRHSSAEPQLTL